MTARPTPLVLVPGDPRAASALLGLPVRRGDGTDRHDPACVFCGGVQTDDNCPRSVELRAYAERRVNPFRPHPPRCRRCSQALDTCPCNDDGGVS